MRPLLRHAVLLAAYMPAMLAAQSSTPWCRSSASVSPDILVAAQAYQPRGGTRYVKVKAIIASQVGPGGDASAPSIVQRDIDGMNEIFAQSNTGIQFELCGPVQIVDDNALHAAWSFNPAAINPYYEPGYFTLVYTTMLPNNLGGLAMGDIVYMLGQGNPTIAAHELGHALGLPHTHDVITEAELVDGSNCGTAGDFICDTPADPNLGQAGMVDYATCNYIGTATDANGQPYAPLVDNIMSYAQCNSIAFTPGQVQVMQYVLDNVKTNIRRSAQPVAIDPFSTRLCHNVGPITLSATPAPGTFGGPLVNGDTLINTPNPPSEYYVTWTPTTPPQDSTTFIDQSNTFFDQYAVYNYTYTVFDSLVQTIRAGADGRLTQVDFRIHDPLLNNFRLRVYAGEGAGVVLLHETTLAAPAIADTAWLSIPVSDFVPIANHAVYTLELVADHAFTLVTGFGANWAYYDYTRGSSNVDAYRDAVFRTWVHGLPPCQSAIRYYELYQGPPRYMLNLADAYCITEVDTVWLFGDNDASPLAEIWIDGVDTSAFIPSLLGEGAHELLYINSVFGCTDTTVSPINVTMPAPLTVPALGSPICLTTPPFVLEGDPPGGYITINGLRDSLLNAAALGIGAHNVQYHFAELLDSIAFVDQTTGIGSYASGAQGTVEVGTTIWQSFTPAFSGRLEEFIVSLYGVNGPFEYGVKLLRGTGPGGTVIATDTITVPPNTSLVDILGAMQVEVLRDSVYTMQLERLSDALPTANQIYYFTDGSRYPRGTGQFGSTADIDFYFKETVSRIYTCADSITVPFTVEVCTGMPEQDLGTVLIGPNPFSDVLTLRAGWDLEYVLYNAVGAELLSGIARGGSPTSLSTAHLAAGLYMVRVNAEDSTVQRTLAVVKE